MQCYNQRMIEIVKARQQQEKNRLPKIQRSEAKTRMAMFKKSLRINSSGSSSEDREKIKQVNLKLDLDILHLTLGHPTMSLFLSVLSTGGQATEGWEAPPAAQAWEPDEGAGGPVWEQHEGAAAAAGQTQTHLHHWTRWNFQLDQQCFPVIGWLNVLFCPNITK